MPDIFQYINQKEHPRSKYQAIVQGILDAIEANALSKGDPLPSVNSFIQKLGIARMTVVKALNNLKERGVIYSEDKVGYFIKDVNLERKRKVFLFLNTFDSYHQVLYNSIIDNIDPGQISIDLFFHHCNPLIFKSVLIENLGSYGLYIISGFCNPDQRSLLDRIPSRKLLQIMRPPALEGIPWISQDFYDELKIALNKIISRLKKYTTFILIFPSWRGHPEIIKVTFKEFCEENGIHYRIEETLRPELIREGNAFWVIEDSDLLNLIKGAEKLGLSVGRDLGILSYNETPMKEIIRNGITVVSIDFAAMGKSIASYIKNPDPVYETFSPKVILRNSL
ncbi:MAG: GntR family transcriptional regulator [Bacteroidales bacterium]|nr:GntR family transcriptional regulator [Bacteroidales bacterium]